MTLKDALEMYFKPQETLPPHAKFLGIKLGKTLLTPEMLTDKGWGYVIENNDPKFAEALKGLIGDLKENGPLVSEDGEVSRLN